MIGGRPVPRHRVVAVAVVIAAALAGCSSQDPSPADTADELDAEQRVLDASCNRIARDLRDTVQTTLDQLEAPDGDVLDTPAPALDPLIGVATRFRQRFAEDGCDPGTTRGQVADALGAVSGGGPVGRAIVPVIRDAVVDPAGPVPTVVVAPGDDLVAAVHGAGPGAVVEVEPGEHVLEEPLVTLRGVRLRGAGTGATTIASAAPDAVVLHLGLDTFEADGITFAHDGARPASVLVLSNGSYDLRDVEVTGGVGDDGAVGYGLVIGGVLLPPETSLDTESVVGLRVTDNDAGGVAVVDGRRPAMTDLVVTGNGSCGLCFIGDGGGEVAGASLVDNEIGATFTGTSAPFLGDVTVEDSATVGVLVEGESAPVFEQLVVVQPAGGVAAIGLRGSGAPVIAGLEATGGDEVTVLVEEQSRAQLHDLALGGAPVGLLVRDDAVPVVQRLSVEDVVDASTIHASTSGGSVEVVACPDDVPGVVLVEDTVVEVVGDGCEVLDQRGLDG